MFLGPTTAYPNFSEPAPKRFNAEQPPSNVSKDGEEKKANLEDRGRCVIFQLLQIGNSLISCTLKFHS